MAENDLNASPGFVAGPVNGTGDAAEKQGEAQLIVGLLQATLNACKCTAIVSLVWDGPQWRVFAVSLGLGERPETIERMAGALALAAGSDSCRVSRDNGRVLLEIPKPQKDRLILSALRLDSISSPAPTAVPLGIATGGKVTWLDISDERHAHVLIGGTTGSGKTALLRWILYRLSRQNDTQAMRMILIDPKVFELTRFSVLPHLLHPICSDTSDVIRVLTWVTDEIERRMHGTGGPRLLVVIEEVAELVARERSLVKELLERIAQVGRAVRVNLIITTQQPSVNLLGTALANFPTRVIGRVASATLNYGTAGRKQTEADTLLGRGDFLLLTAGSTVRFQAPLLQPWMLDNLPRRIGNHQPLELPSAARINDMIRDPRGGHNRRELSDEEYKRLQEAVAKGASIEQLRKEFGIGWRRATRLRELLEGAK